MRRGAGAVLLGMALLLASLGLDFGGADLHSLLLLILSFAVGIAGAVVALRGLLEFLGDLL